MASSRRRNLRNARRPIDLEPEAQIDDDVVIASQQSGVYYISYIMQRFIVVVEQGKEKKVNETSTTRSCKGNRRGIKITPTKN